MRAATTQGSEVCRDCHRESLSFACLHFRDSATTDDDSRLQLRVEQAHPVHLVFALAGSRDERNFHLIALMAIAQIVQNPDFMNLWRKARNEEELRNLILLAERVRKAEV